MKIASVDEMNDLERRSGLAVSELIENAGLSVATTVKRMLGSMKEKKVLVLAGSGNNGNDGLVAARHLHDWGAKVSIYLLKPRNSNDTVLAPLIERGLEPLGPTVDGVSRYQALEEALTETDLVVDALLGTGTSRLIDGRLGDLLKRLAAARARSSSPPLLSIDLPTGLDADSGAVDPLCVVADQTVALALSKVGMHTLPGAHYTGTLEIADIGIPSPLTEKVKTELMTKEWVKSLLPERPEAANKGAFGRVIVIAGSPNYIGAACLATIGSARVGSGLTTLACANSLYPILATKLTEATFISLPDEGGYLSAEAAYTVGKALSGDYDALLVGCGLGEGEYVRAFMQALMPTLGKGKLQGVVIDADGLNNLAKIGAASGPWWKDLSVPIVVTPHPGEMARLSGLSVKEIQSDRLSAARVSATNWETVVVLKGAHTVIAAPDGRAQVSPFANPSLASAGTGDILAGAITSFIAQGLDPFDAASIAVFVHGLAGERLRADLGDAGTVASDMLPELPRAIKELKGQ